MTALFLNYISNIKLFNIYLLSQNPEEKNEFKIPSIIKRVIIKFGYIRNLIIVLIKKKIDVLIYQFPNGNEINVLNKLKKIKIMLFLLFILTKIIFN